MMIKTKMVRQGNTNTHDYRNKYNHGVKTTMCDYVAERIGNHWNMRKREYKRLKYGIREEVNDQVV